MIRHPAEPLVWTAGYAAALEAAGIAAGAIPAFIAAIEADDIDLHGMLLLHRGATIAEASRAPYALDLPHRMNSATKSFTSTAVGLAVSEKRLGVDDRVVDILGVESGDSCGEDARRLTVRHLLTMNGGFRPVADCPPARAPLSIAGVLTEGFVRSPGIGFEYNNANSYLLGAVVQRVTGEPMDAYLRPRLLTPLEIGPRPWTRSDEGVVNGGWGLHLTPRELARFGQLYLQRGHWGGRPLIPEDWIDEATTWKTDSRRRDDAPDWSFGYGYQFWLGRDGSYRADGMLGQFAVVHPQREMVFVTTAETLKTPRILDLCWQYFMETDAEPARSSAANGASASPNPCFCRRACSRRPRPWSR